MVKYVWFHGKNGVAEPMQRVKYVWFHGKKDLKM